MAKYQVEFTNEKIRKGRNEMPYNLTIEAKNKRVALRKFRETLGRKVKNHKIKIEGIWKIRE